VRTSAGTGLLLALLIGSAEIVGAQAVDTATAIQALDDFAAACDDHGRRLWGQPLCGPLVLVHAPTRAAIANNPDPDGSFLAHRGAWVGSLPAGLATANTSVSWGGAEWAMVLLPLPPDAFDRLALLAHEAFHRVQDELGLSAPDAQNPHLDEEQGRVWLRMELRALAEALRHEGVEGRAALLDALRFRDHRYHLYPGADTLEALLERHEGLAEYTGAVFAMSVLDTGVDPVLHWLERFERRPSFVRALGYGTGPALGLLLDRHAPGWRDQAGRRPLASLLAEAVGFTGLDAVAAADLVARAERYGYDAVAAEESRRARESAARLADIRARLLDGPVVALRQDDLRASFNPNELVPVGEEGTYYPTGTFQAAWGSLAVTAGGALVSPDWRAVRVPAPTDGPAAVGGRITGEGWTLDLAEGWTVQPAGDGAWRAIAEK
jgi:hypothetical protein